MGRRGKCAQNDNSLSPLASSFAFPCLSGTKFLFCQLAVSLFFDPSGAPFDHHQLQKELLAISRKFRISVVSKIINRLFAPHAHIHTYTHRVSPSLCLCAEMEKGEEVNASKDGNNKDSGDGSTMTRPTKPPIERVTFQFLKIDIMLEYLHYQYRSLGVSAANYNNNSNDNSNSSNNNNNNEATVEEEVKDVDFDRVVNDFVLVCMLAGNDFLPSLECVGMWSTPVNICCCYYHC